MSPGMTFALIVGGASILGIWVLSRRLPHVVDDDWRRPPDEEFDEEGPTEELREAGMLERIRAQEILAEQRPTQVLPTQRLSDLMPPAEEPPETTASDAAEFAQGQPEFLYNPLLQPPPAPEPQSTPLHQEPPAPVPMPAARAEWAPPPPSAAPAPWPEPEPEPVSVPRAVPPSPTPAPPPVVAPSRQPAPAPPAAAPSPAPSPPPWPSPWDRPVPSPAARPSPATPSRAPEAAPVFTPVPAPQPAPVPAPVLAPAPRPVPVPVPVPAKAPIRANEMPPAPPLRFQGVIRGDSSRHSDGRERRYITVKKKEAKGFPWREGGRVPVDLEVNGKVYSAGVRSTRSQSVVYIAADLHGPVGEKVTLAAVLEEAGVQKRQQVTIEVERGTLLRLIPGALPPEEKGRGLRRRKGR